MQWHLPPDHCIIMMYDLYYIYTHPNSPQCGSRGPKIDETRQLVVRECAMCCHSQK